MPNEIFEIAEITGLPWTKVILICQMIAQKSPKPSIDTILDIHLKILSGKSLQEVCDEYGVVYI